MSKDNSKSGLENTSDRFKRRSSSEGVAPMEVPLGAIEKLRELRRLGLISNRQNFSIINIHKEICLNLTDCGAWGRDYSELVSDVRTSDGRRLNSERFLETLDIYFIRGLISSRLRYYFQNKRLVSSRKFVVDLSLDGKKGVEQRKIAGEMVPIRDEWIFLERVDRNQRNSIKRIRENSKKFFGKGVRVCTAVYKKVFRFNFGEDTIWDHRDAYFVNEKGERIDATREEAVLGMGPFMAFLVQEVEMGELGEEQELDGRTRNQIDKMILGKFGAKDFYKKFCEYYGCRKSKYVRFEMEFGQKYEGEIGSVIGSLIEGLRKRGVSFVFDCKRKICI